MRRKRQLFPVEDGHGEAEINLTSLIDVVFVVLIMFIIVAPLLELDRVKLAGAALKNDKENSVVQEISPITIYVKEDNSIWLGKKQLSLSDLAKFLKIAKQHPPTPVPQLFHDKKGFFGTYQSVKNAVEEAGFEELDVILEPN